MAINCNPDDMRELGEMIVRNKIGEVTASMEKGGSPSLTDNPVVGEMRRKLGWGMFRTMRGTFGPEFSARVLNPLMITVNKFESFRSNAFKDFIKDLEPIGIKNWLQRFRGPDGKDDRAIFDALIRFDDAGNFQGPRGTVDSGVLESARRIHGTMRRIAGEHDVRMSMYMEYRRALHEMGLEKGPLLWNPAAPFAKQFNAKMKPEEVPFFQELERRGTFRNWDSSASSLYKDFVNTVGSKRILTPQITALEKAEVRPFFDAKYVVLNGKLHSYASDPGYQMWHELVNHIYGQPTGMDRKLATAWNRSMETFGIKTSTDPSAVYSVAQAISNLFYAGVLSTPGAVIRQAFQLVPAYANLGVRPIAYGISKATDRMYIKSLVERGILTPPLEAIHEQVGLARSAGRYIHGITEAALKVFDLSDRTMRVITAAGAEFQFDEAVSKGLSSLRASREIKDQILKLAQKGASGVKEARDLYMMDVIANTQYVYGRVNRPEIFRGALGHVIGMLQSYPLNWAEMYVQLTKRAIRGTKGFLGKSDDPISEVLPLLRQLALTSAIMMGGTQAFGVDMSSAFLAFPGQSPLLQTGSAMFSGGRTNLEWLWGQAFSVGETDFHKRLRTEANDQLVRAAINFVPGGLIGRRLYEGYVVDQPTHNSIMKLMGFPPLAEDINLEVREKAAAKRREKRLETLAGTD